MEVLTVGPAATLLRILFDDEASLANVYIDCMDLFSVRSQRGSTFFEIFGTIRWPFSDKLRPEWYD